MRMGKALCLRKDFQLCALPVGAEISRLVSSFNINDLDSPSRKDEEAQLLAGRLAFIFNWHWLRASSDELGASGCGFELAARGS